MADTIDPFAGSYAIEAMTNEIEKKAMEYIEKIDQMGGMIKAIETVIRPERNSRKCIQATTRHRQR